MMKVPVVRSPLSIVALFVILIEAFLAYPLTQLQEPERLVIVIFMVLLFFLSFIFLWKKPVHFYNPKEIPSDLRTIYQSESPRTSALELRLEELQNDYNGLLKRITRPAVKFLNATIGSLNVSTLNPSRLFFIVFYLCLYLD